MLKKSLKEYPRNVHPLMLLKCHILNVRMTDKAHILSVSSLLVAKVPGLDGRSEEAYACG